MKKKKQLTGAFVCDGYCLCVPEQTVGNTPGLCGALRVLSVVTDLYVKFRSISSHEFTHVRPAASCCVSAGVCLLVSSFCHPSFSLLLLH